jgi:hypothetical protein
MKIRILYFFLLLAAPNLWADDVTLQSNDNKTFKVPLEVAQRSETLKGIIQMAENGLDVGGKNRFISLSIMDAKTLGRAIAVMRWLVSNPKKDFADYLYKNWILFSTPELVDVIGAIHFLDVKPHDMLNAALKFYGGRIFGDAELTKIAKIGTFESYATYEKENLSLPSDLQKIFISQNLQSIDRIFLDKSPDRRINAIAQTPLDVAQIIAYIAKNQTESANKLPKIMLEVLEKWQGKDFAKKIHFGPWPTEFATWPSHCPLQSNPKYNLYSDGTPDDRYINNGDGTVTDVCTKLVWEQAPPTLETPLQESKDRCAKLNNEVVKNWRLPTRIELQTIVNYEAANPALNGVFRNGTATFWSSTPAHQVIYFAEGMIGLPPAIESYRSRCVRGEAGGPQSAGAQHHYSYHDDGKTVNDNFTGAVWQRHVNNDDRTPEQALDYCANLEEDGKGWLLPTVKQLSTLIDTGVRAPAIDIAAFPQTPNEWFWSRTARVNGLGGVWGVHFRSGLVTNFAFVGNNRVRCVR